MPDGLAQAGPFCFGMTAPDRPLRRSSAISGGPPAPGLATLRFRRRGGIAAQVSILEAGGFDGPRDVRAFRERGGEVQLVEVMDARRSTIGARMGISYSPPSPLS
jgi:hypothetical protein